MPKIWIYNSNKSKFFQLDRDDPRLVWDHPNAPAGSVILFERRDHNDPFPRWAPFARRGAKDKWSYVTWGETKQACCDAVNSDRVRQIAKLEADITELKSRMVKCDG